MPIDFIADTPIDFRADNQPELQFVEQPQKQVSTIDFQPDTPVQTSNPTLQGGIEMNVNWQDIANNAKEFGKGLLQGVSSLGVGIGKQFGNTWRRNLGMPELTDYEM